MKWSIDSENNTITIDKTRQNILSSENVEIVKYTFEEVQFNKIITIEEVGE